MTRKESIEILIMLKGAWAQLDGTPDELKAASWAVKALDAAISALRGPTREQVEKMRNGCYMCDEYKYFMFNAWKNPESSELPDCMGASLFCPHCGKPLTDEAVDMVMERLEEMLNDQ